MRVVLFQYLTIFFSFYEESFFSALLLNAYLMTGCNGNQNSQSAADGKATDSAGNPKQLTAEDARKIAKDAYIYGYPMVDGYRIQHTYF